MSLPSSLPGHLRNLFLLGLGWLTACSPPVVKLGYINSVLVMQQYHGTAARRQLLGRQAGRWQHSLDSLTAMVTALQPAVPARTQALDRYRASLQQRVQAASQQADQALVKEVNAYLQRYGAAHDYAFIFGATEAGTIVYAASPQNLTMEVLAGLNKEYDQAHASAN